MKKSALTVKAGADFLQVLSVKREVLKRKL